MTAIRLEDPDLDAALCDPGVIRSTPRAIRASPARLPPYWPITSAMNTAFMLQSPAVPGWVRFYPSFSAAIDEVADARVFAGIHFRAACEDGAVLGSDVAGYILENRMRRHPRRRRIAGAARCKSRIWGQGT